MFRASIACWLVFTRAMTLPMIVDNAIYAAMLASANSSPESRGDAILVVVAGTPGIGTLGLSHHRRRPDRCRGFGGAIGTLRLPRLEEHTSELQSRHISYAVFCLKKKKVPQLYIM